MLVTLIIAFFYVMVFFIPVLIIWGAIDAWVIDPMKDKAYQEGFDDGSKLVKE